MDWKLAAVGAVVFVSALIALVVLTLNHAVSGEVITGLVMGVFGWLLKSPLPSTSKPQVQVGTVNVG